MKKPTEPFKPNKPNKYELISENLSFAWKKEFNLNDLLKMLPKGIKKENITFSTVEVGEEDYLLKVSYSHKRINPNYKEQLKIYNIANLAYEKLMVKHKKYMKDYIYWSLGNELKEHQKAISNIKRRLNNKNYEK